MKSLPILALILSLTLITWCSNDRTWSEMKSETHEAIQTKASISQETKDILIKAYQEELLAHDIYQQILKKYPQLSWISNIIESEDQHRKQIGNLLNTYQINEPQDYGSYSGIYSELTEKLNASMTWALEVGVMIEVWDIEHLLQEYKSINDTSIQMVFENIGGWSFNHLRAFIRMAWDHNYEITTPYHAYITQDDLQSRGSLQFKMSELLKQNNLPSHGVKKGKWEWS